MPAKEIKLQIPRKSYEQLLETFGTHDNIVNAISFYFDTKLRQKKGLIATMDEMDEEIDINFYVRDYLHPLINDYAAAKGKSIREILIKAIPHICRARKRMRLDT